MSIKIELSDNVIEILDEVITVFERDTGNKSTREDMIKALIIHRFKQIFM